MVGIVERLNRGNSPEEASIAEELTIKMNYKGTGGSDAHFVSAIAKCMTAFENEILDESGLVAELLAGRFHAVTLEDAIID